MYTLRAPSIPISSSSGSVYLCWIRLPSARIPSYDWHDIEQVSGVSKSFFRGIWRLHQPTMSDMRKSRKVILITDLKRNTPPSPKGSPAHEEFRILSCRKTADSVTFHLGPPLFQSSRARNQEPAKILPFPRSWSRLRVATSASRPRDSASGRISPATHAWPSR